MMDTANEPQPATSTRRPRRKGLYAAALVVLAAAAGLSLLRRSDDPTRPVVLGEILKPGAAKGYNVLLVTLDTTRPDRLGMYGYKKAQTPALDSLLEHGVRFDDAITSAPTTLPSHATLLTGRYPAALGVRSNGYHKLGPEALTLGEVLQAQGYETSAFVSAFVLDPRYGTAQGFEVYDLDVTKELKGNPLTMRFERQADNVTNSALRWLGKRDPGAGSPFFMWLHYYDPHDPHVSPLFGTPGLEDSYDAEIAFVDVHFKRVLQFLDERGLREQTLIVVASDHGESLGEQGYHGHGLFVYESSMRVALVLSCPSLIPGPGRVDDRLVGLVDVVPTLTELLGCPTPQPLDGISLLRTEADPNRAIYIETCYPRDFLGCGPLLGLRRLFDKFILAPRSEYYDLRKDPRELRNLYVPDKSPSKELHEQLLAMMSAWPEDDEMRDEMTPEEVRQLESLGYVSSNRPGRENCDPKDQLQLDQQMKEVDRLMLEGRFEEAYPLAMELIEEGGCWITPYLGVAKLYMQRNQLAEAAEVLENFAKSCSHATAHCLLADIYRQQGRLDDAMEQLNVATLVNPQLGLAYECRGDLYADKGQFDKAVSEYEQALQIDPYRLDETQLRKKLADARRRAQAQSQ